MSILFSRFQGAVARIWSPYDTLEQGAVRGGALAFSGRFLIKILQFAKTIVLARLLFPEDFGLFALASVVLGAVDMLFLPGFHAALVHEKGDIRKYLNSVWTFNILRYSSLGLLVILIAPWYAAYFEIPEAANLIRALAVVVILTGFENIGIVLLQKELLFRRKFLLDISLVVAEVITVIIAAYILRSAWALVIGSIANRLAAVFFSYVFHPYRPRIELRWEHIHHLFNYGKWLWGVAVLSFIMSRGDTMVIGKLLDEKILGYYQLALALALLPAVEVGRVLSGVLFPFFSKIQEDTQRLATLFVGNLRVVFALVWPVTFCFAALAHEFVAVFYGERWLPMATIASVAVFLGLFRAFENVSNSLLMGVGHPGISTKSLAVQAAVMFAFIVPLVGEYGAVGAIFAMLLGSIAAGGLVTYSLRALSVSMWKVLGALSFALLPALLMYVLIRWFTAVTAWGNGETLFVGLCIGVISYSVILYIFDFVTGKRMIHSLLWLRKNS